MYSSEAPIIPSPTTEVPLGFLAGPTMATVGPTMASILLGRRRPPILSTVPLILSSPHNIATFSTCSRGLAPVVKKKQPHGRRNLIRRYASNVATTVAAGGVVSIAVILAGLWLGQRRIIWVGQAANGVAFDPQPIDPSLGGEVIRLGPTHVGYYFPPKKKKRPIAESQNCGVFSWEW